MDARGAEEVQEILDTLWRDKRIAEAWGYSEAVGRQREGNRELVLISHNEDPCVGGCGCDA